MKIPLFYSMSALVIMTANAQAPVPPSYLDINQVKALITNNASNLFQSNGQSKYEVPKGSGKNVDFASSIWLGGKGQNGTLSVAAQTYGFTTNRVDFWPGPVDSLNPTPSNGNSYFINNRFKVNKSAIDSFKQAWSNGQVQNGSYTIPNSITIWPGVFPLNSTNQLAPFFDNNNDNIYNPLNGDYPLIKGDQAIFAVFNDVSNVKTSTGTSGVGFEVRRLSYAYNYPSLPANLQVLNYTTFHEYTVINKGLNAIDSFYIGIFDDPDIGGPNDDYIGCDVTNEVGYAYNGDALDASFAGSIGYQTEVPIYGYKLFRTAGSDGVDNDNDTLIDEADENLIREMSGFTYFNNNITAFGDPINGQEFYNYLNTKFRPGDNLVYGDNGTPAIGTLNVKTRYVYPGLSDPQNLGTNNNIPGPAPVDINSNSILIPNGWTEGNNNINSNVPNAAGDRRFVLSSRPTTLAPGQVRQFNTAQIFTDNPQSLSFNALLPIAQQGWKLIDSMYRNSAFPNNGNISSTSLNSSIESVLQGFPNPAKNEFYVKGLDAKERNVLITIKDVQGKIMKQYKDNKESEYLKIDLKTLENGIYFITINKTKTFQVIKSE
jgi:hypothetical protein